MTSQKLRFALGQLSSGDWQTFERFCSRFLVPEFPSFRTTANPAGDKGRDGEAFNLEGERTTAFQFSVAADWRKKIRDTVSTLQRNGLTYNRLVYCTNQEVGALGDAVKSELWDQRHIRLDIYDRDWFCERERTTPERTDAAEDLSALIVGPILSSEGISTSTGSPLKGADARVALVHLALNAEDRAGDRNLTKTSFDALVLSVLVDTSQESVLEEREVIRRVKDLTPHGMPQQVADLTRSALTRLSRKNGPVKHNAKKGGFHVSYGAAKKWQEAAAGYVLQQKALEEDLMSAARGRSAEFDTSPSLLRAEAATLRSILEAVMLRSGEAFAAAVEGEGPPEVTVEQLVEEISAADFPLHLNDRRAADAILDVLSSPSTATRQHLTRVLDAYTLLAFLQQTPDVQKAMSRAFDNAKIWVDTSVLLPLVAETLIDDACERQQATLLSAATASGVSFFVTDATVRELRNHIQRCLAYMRASIGRYGGAPFLYASYIMSGRDEGDFPDWVEDLCGKVNPDLDIEEFLSAEFSIDVADLTAAADAADPILRSVTHRLFYEKHSRPKLADQQREQDTINQLTDHDVNCSLGIMQLRQGSKHALGHEYWWLTLDKTAFHLGGRLRREIGSDAPAPPALSPDYLSQLLRLGPLRRNIENAAALSLPFTVDIDRFETVPKELIDLARTTRNKFAGLGERRIAREVRDALHLARTTLRKEHDYSSDTQNAVEARLQAQGGHGARSGGLLK